MENSINNSNCNVICSKDIDEERVVHSKSDNVRMMTYDKADEIIEELSESLLNRYEIGLETSMKDSDFIFFCVHLWYYKCHEINQSWWIICKFSLSDKKEKKQRQILSTMMINAVNTLQQSS